MSSEPKLDVSEVSRNPSADAEAQVEFEWILNTSAPFLEKPHTE